MKLTHALKLFEWRSTFSKRQSIIRIISLVFILSVRLTGYSQQLQTFNLGSEPSFSQELIASKKSELLLTISKDQKVKAQIQVKEGDTEQYRILGTLTDYSNATFSITKQNGIVEGTIVLYQDKKAYQYYTNDLNQVVIQQKDIHQVLCVDFKKNSMEDELKEFYNDISSKMAPDLQSLPGSAFTVYLDFDGEEVSGTSWAGGATINAQPAGFSDEKITNIWRIMAEDFRPFDINITTNRAIYEATPINQRMMCIFTPTDTAAPGTGGVAYLNSFSSTNSDNPCWTFNSGTRSAGETGSHEVGHTLGLSHDGVPGNQYYSGHGKWSPIMGWSASRTLGHWSKGEYDNAINTEDDLAIITNTRNGFGYKADDHADTLVEATQIAVDTDGNVNPDQNAGLITTSEDKDIFSFITSGGAVSFTIDPDPFYPNLNIQARIVNGLGEEIEVANPTNSLGAQINTTLAGGTYFLEIDGVGEGNLSTGFSDYASIGFYDISGSYPPGDNNQPPIANFEVTTDCNTVSFQNTSINSVTSYSWDFGDGNTSNLQNPEHIYENSGQYTVSLTVTNDIGSDTNTQENIIDISIPTIPDTNNEVTGCSGEDVTLTATGSNGYIWYDQPQNGNIIGTGSSITLSEVLQSQNLYVAGTSQPVISDNVGISVIEANDGNIHNGGFFLIFDTQEPVMLKKAKILAQGTKDRVLELRDAQDNLISSKTINIPDGENILDINLEIPAGNNLQIGFTEGADLFRTNQNINYPYEIDNVVSIKQSTASSDPSGFYYYLYDWQISTLGGCETASRVEVAITVSESPETPVIITNDQTDELIINNSYNSYQWYLNEQPIEGASNANHFAIQTGSYTVEVFNAGECSAISESVLIETLSVNTPELADKVVLYPNPAKEILYINGLEQVNDEIYSIKVVNILGQPILSYHSLVTSIDTSILEEGVYFLLVNNKATKKFLKSSP